ncbi:Bug family tripartite tricarboxylate transporter substrate binding protein [Methylobacterium tardum]|uniref:Bug family tripartite tricarboxylate transporter substrate binding protein n=1 Tax=Methylobacterium tardum TaxID=374432 RepID=UPI00360894F7
MATPCSWAVSSHGIAPNLYTHLRYDPVTSFVPIVFIETIPNILAVNKDLPVNSVGELIAYAKAHPDALNFASSGAGASTHLSGEMFKAMTGIKMTHVPFHGSAQALVSVMGNQTQLIFDNMPSVYPYVTAGNMKALAVTTLKPSPQAPTSRPSRRRPRAPTFRATTSALGSGSTPRPTPRARSWIG